MEGKKITSSNFRMLRKKIDPWQNENGKSHGFIRRNTREAWKLKKCTKEIDVEKQRWQSLMRKFESNLMIEEEEIQRTSGNLTTVDLPKLIISPATTQRSQLCWKRSSVRNSEWMYTPSTEKTRAIDEKQPIAGMKMLPRVQKAKEHARVNICDVTLICKRIKSVRNNMKNDTKMRDEKLSPKKSETGLKRTHFNQLRIPIPKGETLTDEILQKWARNSNLVQSREKKRKIDEEK